MNNSIKNETFYTKDHEWINFYDMMAYTGVCAFKLLGYKEIHEITFSQSSGFKKRGEVIAKIKYNDYEIEAHMPVDGRIMKLNRELFTANKNILLRSPENRGWIALIMPLQPSDRIELLALKQYEERHISKYAR